MFGMTLLPLVLLAFALALPSAGAQSAEFEVDSSVNAQGSVEAATAVAVNGHGPVRANAEVQVRSARPVEDRDEPSQAPGPGMVLKHETAAIEVAIGVILLLGAWAGLKYGAMLSVGAPLFSRIASHRILENEVRNRVHECVAATPGVTIKEVATLLGIGWGTAVYHLRRLEDERLIASHRNRQFRRYYRNGGEISSGDRVAFAELQNPITERLASEIMSQPGTGQKALCEAVGISAPLAHKHLVWLVEADLLTRERDWKAVKYFPTARLRGFLAQS